MRGPGRGKRKLSISRREEVRTLLLVCGGIAIPLAAVVLAISGTSRPYLSELAPIRNSAEEYAVRLAMQWARRHFMLWNEHASKQPTEEISRGISSCLEPYQLTRRWMPRACLLLAMNSCSLLSVISQRWLLRALILRT